MTIIAQLYTIKTSGFSNIKQYKIWVS